MLTACHFTVPGFEDDQVQAVALVAVAAVAADVVPDAVDFQANPWGPFIYYVSTYLISHNIFTNFFHQFVPFLCTKNFKLQS